REPDVMIWPLSDTKRDSTRCRNGKLSNLTIRHYTCYLITILLCEPEGIVWSARYVKGSIPGSWDRKLRDVAVRRYAPYLVTIKPFRKPESVVRSLDDHGPNNKQLQRKGTKMPIHGDTPYTVTTSLGEPEGFVRSFSYAIGYSIRRRDGKLLDLA